ncbi:MAG: hypothetical protein ACRDID_02400, partial [Ktedonobacterales bacterium]
HRPGGNELSAFVRAARWLPFQASSQRTKPLRQWRGDIWLPSPRSGEGLGVRCPQTWYQPSAGQ